MFKFIRACEPRVLMSADLSVSNLTHTIPKNLPVTSVAALKAVAKVTLKNTGPDAVGAKEPAYVVKFFLDRPTGDDVLIGTVKAAKYAGLKKGGSVPLSAPLTLPSLTEGSYSVYAVVSAAARGSTDTNATNDKTTAVASFTVPTPPVSALANYGIGDKFTFTQTKLVTSMFGTISEQGKWTDERGDSGTYSYIKASSQINDGLLTLKLTKGGNTPQVTVTLTSIGAAKTLAGKVSFSTAKAGAFGSIPAYSSTAGNYKIYLKRI